MGSQIEKTELVETEVKARVEEGCEVLGALRSVRSYRTLKYIEYGSKIRIL